MIEETTREEILVLAKRAGLDLPESMLEELLSAWRHVEPMTARIAAPRTYADEPAHVFIPTIFAPKER
jgi:hypothetical protein